MISLKQAKERIEEIKKTRTEARAGEIWSVNNKIMKGHKGQILRRKKNNIVFFFNLYIFNYDIIIYIIKI